MPTPSTPIASLGGVGVYIQAKDGDSIVREPVIAKLLPIGATSTTLHFFADPGKIRRIKGWVYGEANRASLEALVAAGTTVNYTSDKGSQGNFVITGFSVSRVQALNYTDSMYAFQAELISQ